MCEPLWKARRAPSCDTVPVRLSPARQRVLVAATASGRWVMSTRSNRVNVVPSALRWVVVSRNWKESSSDPTDDFTGNRKVGLALVAPVSVSSGSW